MLVTYPKSRSILLVRSFVEEFLELGTYCSAESRASEYFERDFLILHARGDCSDGASGDSFEHTVVGLAERAVVPSQLAFLCSLEMLAFCAPDWHFWILDPDAVFRTAFIDDKFT